MSEKFSEPASDFPIRDAAPPGQISRAFMQGMANRMATSYYKYGHVRDSFPEPMSAIGALRDRLAQYEKTGNTEWLMDVANYAMIEYMHPRHPEAHFRATDSNESPGRIDNTGRRVK
jgi:hypothetical protein